jgi:hypothetical protein
MRRRQVAYLHERGLSLRLSAAIIFDGQSVISDHV